MKELDEIFSALANSPFRRKFKLAARERNYLLLKGLPAVVEHARDFVEQRLAPANPANDGEQTPFRGHPVFVAQHATGTCCRTCLSKWHDIPAGHALTEEEKSHVVAALERWLDSQQKIVGEEAPTWERQLRLF